jgi:hypothetical protein
MLVEQILELKAREARIALASDLCIQRLSGDAARYATGEPCSLSDHGLVTGRTARSGRVVGRDATCERFDSSRPSAVDPLFD